MPEEGPRGSGRGAGRAGCGTLPPHHTRRAVVAGHPKRRQSLDGQIGRGAGRQQRLDDLEAPAPRGEGELGLVLAAAVLRLLARHRDADKERRRAVVPGLVRRCTRGEEKSHRLVVPIFTGNVQCACSALGVPPREIGAARNVLLNHLQI